jgi:hypothetical protein
MPEPVDDLCAQVGCLDRGICFREGRWAGGPLDDPEYPPHCHRALALPEPARPYNLRLAVWRAFLRRIGLARRLPTRPWEAD